MLPVGPDLLEYVFKGAVAGRFSLTHSYCLEILRLKTFAFNGNDHILLTKNRL